ncbi:MAG: hypothetical protein AB3N63_00035 [Puniceicoccaceae bacterium]
MNEKPSSKAKSRSGQLLLKALILVPVIALSGCAAVPAYEQAELSRPGMLFSDSPALADGGSLIASVEPGTDDRGGAAASGCTVCQ